MRNKIFAGFAMALGLSFHFFGYECARAASISLLAAKVINIYFMLTMKLSFLRKRASEARHYHMYRWWDHQRAR
jgi:hypothetical protein